MFQKISNKLNDLRPKQLLILAAVAGLLMFLTIIAAMSLVSNREVAVVPVPLSEKEVPSAPVIEKKAVVVAKVNIPPRTRIQESMLQLKELPVDAVPEGAIESLNEVKDVQVKVSIFAGDILTVQKVFKESSNEGFVGEIPPDCRAVSINVTEVTGVAGFAKPGDKVDLLLVEKGQYSATSNILLQNVPLLSVNQDMTGSNILDDNGIVKTSAISNPTIATVALPPQDILKLISAAKLGEIYMMLRPSNPRSSYVEPMEYTIESINKPQPEVPLPAIPNAPLPELPAQQNAPKFDIIQGDQLVQSSQPTPPVTPSTPTRSSSQNSSLPAIPSRSANSESVTPPTTNVPVINSFSRN